ncbi:MAG: XRE family transcriptional regulator [Snowella sp.]|nr:MAG: XRE family transcriptional regulator [Snowella sp.]
MKRDYIEVFAAKLRKYGIKGKDLAEASGRNPKTISEILNRKASPSIESFNHLIECCDQLSPGFADEYYLALVGPIDFSPEQLIRRLDTSQLASLMYAIGQRIQDYGQSQRKDAIAS